MTETKTRTRRTAEELAEYHLKQALTNMTLEEKVRLARDLKENIETEVANRKAAAEAASKLAEGL